MKEQDTLGEYIQCGYALRFRDGVRWGQVARQAA